MTAGTPGGRVLLLTIRGWLRVIICPQCAALVLAVGRTRHEDQHRADARRDDR